MGVTVKDTGFSRYKQVMQELNGSTVEVGLFANEDAELITYVATNEFGTNRAGKNRNITIPERPFMRDTFNKMVGKVRNRFEQIAGAVGRGNFSINQKLKYK